MQFHSHRTRGGKIRTRKKTKKIKMAMSPAGEFRICCILGISVQASRSKINERTSQGRMIGRLVLVLEITKESGE